MDSEEHRSAKSIINSQLAGYGYEVLGWRDVPTDGATVGKSAMLMEPKMEQIFLAPGKKPAFGHLEMEQQVGINQLWGQIKA